MAKLEAVEGIGPVYAEKLREAGIATTEALLKQCATRQGRRELAAPGLNRPNNCPASSSIDSLDTLLDTLPGPR